MKDSEIENLLPWYVNGTLDASEAVAVESLLQRSPQARQQVELLRGIAQQVKSEEPAPVSELGWRRLQKDIRAERSVNRQDWWRRGLVAAAMLVIALQVGILAKDPATDTSTHLLSEGTLGFEQPHWLLQVEFQDETQWQVITELLNSINARVVDGPSGIGLILIGVPKTGAQFDSAEQLLTWLRQQAVVAHVAVEGQQ